MTAHLTKSECPIAAVLDIVGDRWTLLVIRDMPFGGRHEHREFLQSAERISTNILADRLKPLSASRSSGLIRVTVYPSDRKRKLYCLTDSGRKLIYSQIELSLW